MRSTCVHSIAIIYPSRIELCRAERYICGMCDTTVISLGGSIVAPDGVDTDFLEEFATTIKSYLSQRPQSRVVLVVGGGSTARGYQEAYRKLVAKPDRDTLDWIGIAATRINAVLIRGVFAEYCTDEVVTDPSAEFQFTGRVLVGAGWKPGFSSDYDSVLLAKRLGANLVVNLSNIAMIYSEDPAANPAARPYRNLTWSQLVKLVGTEWIPGQNVPFDPIATREAMESGLRLIVAAGRALPNLENILEGREFVGTIVGD